MLILNWCSHFFKERLSNDDYYYDDTFVWGGGWEEDGERERDVVAGKGV